MSGLMIRCGSCGKEVLEVNPHYLAEFKMSNRVRAQFFKSVYPGVCDPLPNHMIKCPGCGHNYYREIEAMWKSLQYLPWQEKDWDE